METIAADAPAATPLATAPLDDGGFGSSLDAFFESQMQDLAQDVTPTPEVTPKEPAKEPEATPKTGDEPAPEPASEVDELFEETDTVKDWTPQAARRFKEVKAEAKQFKVRAAELEQELSQRDARLQELEALANDPRVKDLTSRAEEYEHAMLLRNLEGSNAYKQLVAEPLSRMVGEIDGIAEKYSLDGDALIDVVVMDDEAAQDERLSELLARASDRDKSRIYNLIDAVKPVLEQRRVLQENAQEALREAEELDRTRAQLDLAERASSRKVAATEIAKRIEKAMPFLKAFDGVDLSKLTDEAAATDFTKVSPELGAYHIMARRLFPKIASEYLTARREIESLTDRLAAYDKAGSPLNGGRADGGSSSGSDGRSFVEAVDAAFGG